MPRSIDYIWAEGALDAVAARKLAAICGCNTDRAVERVATDNGAFLQGLAKFNKIAALGRVVLALGDTESKPCPGAVVANHVSNRAPGLVVRLAVPMIEAWFLADAEGSAKFLGVSRSKIPREPEALPHPKASLIQLAKDSRVRAIREGLAPKDGSTARVGAEYTSRVMNFIDEHWDPRRAQVRSPSLRRAICAIEGAAQL